MDAKSSHRGAHRVVIDLGGFPAKDRKQIEAFIGRLARVDVAVAKSVMASVPNRAWKRKKL